MIMITVSKEEAQQVMDDRLRDIRDLFDCAYRSSNDPNETLKFCKEAVTLYFKTESLIEKLAEGEAE